MTTYTIDEAELASLQGKTILITGAATGIGEAAFKLAIGQWLSLFASDADSLTTRVQRERRKRRDRRLERCGRIEVGQAVRRSCNRKEVRCLQMGRRP